MHTVAEVTHFILLAETRERLEYWRGYITAMLQAKIIDLATFHTLEKMINYEKAYKRD